MDGIHDMGGMHGFGRVEREPNEPLFHAPWERRVYGMVAFVMPQLANIDAFRHAIERMAPLDYLEHPYYGRWLSSLERLVRERGLPKAAKRSELPPGPFRALDRPARFDSGDRVRARDLHVPGHTRLPRYARGRTGVIVRVHAPCVFPDTNAHDRGEDPQHLYCVRFRAADLWGADTEPNAFVHVDLFEPYLEPGEPE